MTARSAAEKYAVLFVHGILGTPQYFQPFLPLVPASWRVLNLQLSGHGGGVRDFSRASMDEWKKQTEGALEHLLSQGFRVVIAAHSMGTLLAIRAALRRPVAAMFLLNVPLRIRPRLRLLKTAYRVYSGKIPSDDVWSLAAKNAYGIEKDLNVFHYAGWVPRYIELFREIRKTRKAAKSLSVKSRVYLSDKDEMVAVKSAKAFKDNSFVTVKVLKSSGHYYYSDADLRLLKSDFSEMLYELQMTESP